MKPSVTACLALTLALAACHRPPGTRLQGYVEGEFVHVASPRAGKLVGLVVQRGDQVKEGDLLFALEHDAEDAALEEATQKLTQARALLADAKKGRRPSEIQSLEAQLEQAREAAALSQADLTRQESLAKTGAATQERLDHARSLHSQNQQRIAQLAAEMDTARQGQRPDAIAALQADVKAREATLAKARWDLAQTRQHAAAAGLVDDTLFRPGELVPAGRPVVSLLPPANIKVRAFIPQTRLAGIHTGDPARVFIDGAAAPVAGRLTFISPQAEYTPPVIYSQENRGKLVFMIEIGFDPATAATLHPGQPVDVEP